MPFDTNIEGNYYNKYESTNPLVCMIMNGFLSALLDLAKKCGAESSYEVGCGEGKLSAYLSKNGFSVRGSDVGTEVVEEANRAAGALDGLKPFIVKNIYDMNRSDTADLMLCCEVMEHLETPERALRKLSEIAPAFVLFSVPREPLWRLLNMLRGKYFLSLGNTPGHIQHWSTRSFIDLVGKYFEIIQIRNPVPWTMILCKKK